MALLLSVETSTQACSVALHKNGELLSYKEIFTSRSAASQLAVMIRDVIAEAQHTPSDLQGIVVAAGPGSYTGLRIGVATAKGMCYALGIPLIAINTLHLMISQVIDAWKQTPSLISTASAKDLLWCPMLDARRMEVYCMLGSSGLEVIEPVQAKVIDENSFASHLAHSDIVFFGEGADKCKDVIQHPRTHFLSDILPLASGMGKLGYEKWQAGLVEDLASFEPFYLKDFVLKKPNLA